MREASSVEPGRLMYCASDVALTVRAYLLELGRNCVGIQQENKLNA